MTAVAGSQRGRELGREAPLLFGGWEVGLLAIMALFYAGGLYLNPSFFGSTDALFSVLRDASRYGVIAVGMTFVIVNKELDLSVGSTYRADGGDLRHGVRAKLLRHGTLDRRLSAASSSASRSASSTASWSPCSKCRRSSRR